MIVGKWTAPFLSDVDFNTLAAACPNFSGADISNLCKEAALHAMTERGPVNELFVTMADFEHCLDWMKPSINLEMLESYTSFQ